MSNYNTTLQSNNSSLQEVLQILQTKAVGNNEAAVLVTPQNFTDEQKAQARENIGAVSKTGVGEVTVENCAFAEKEYPSYNLINGSLTFKSDTYLSASNGVLVENQGWAEWGTDVWGIYNETIPVEAETTYDFKVFDNIDSSGNIITEYRIIGYCLDADGVCLGQTDSQNTGNANQFTDLKSKRIKTLANTVSIRLQVYDVILENCHQIVFAKTDELPDEYTEGEYVLPFAKFSDIDAAKNELTQYIDERATLETAERKAEIEVERTRINELMALEEGSTTGDAELQDIRIGYDGTVYGTAGVAVREQITPLAREVFGISTSTTIEDTLNIGDPVWDDSIWPRHVWHSFTANKDFTIKNISFSACVNNGWVDSTQNMHVELMESDAATVLASGECSYEWTDNATLCEFSVDINGDVSAGKTYYLHFYITTRSFSQHIVASNASYSDEWITVVTGGTKLSSSGNITFDAVANYDNTKMLTCKMLVSVTETTVASTGLTGEVADIKTELNELRETVENIDQTVSRNEHTISTGAKLTSAYVNGVSAIPDMLTVFANGAYFDKDVCDNRKHAHYGVFSHDSTLAIGTDGKLYCAYLGNSVDLGDNPGSINAFTSLAIIDSEGFGIDSTVTNVEISKNGDTVNGLTITSGTGVPNCVFINDTILRVFFSAKLSDGAWYLMYRDYNTSTEAVGDISIANLLVSSTSYAFTTSNISEHITNIANVDSMISMNAQIAKGDDGYWYCGVCINTYAQSSIIFRSSDMTNFELWVIPEFENESKAVFEGASCIKDGYLYYALRQQTNIGTSDHSTRKMLIAKINMSTKEVVDEYMIVDAGSRACWCVDGNDIYLFHSICSRYRLEIIKLDTSALCNSVIVLQSAMSMIYPSCTKYNNEYYFSATGSSGTSVYLRKARSINKYTVQDIESKIYSSLYLNED